MGLGKVFSNFGKGLSQEIKENKQKYVFVLIALLVLGGAGTIGFWEYANSPAFCTGCHDMSGFAQAIKNSKHKDVSCVECHLPPGFINHVKFKMVDGMLSGVYFLTGKQPPKANAHVSEGNCKRCHEEKIKGMAPKKFKGLPFDHNRHLGNLAVGGFNLQCTTCHRQTTEEVHVDVNKEVCAECHHNMKDANRCVACHQPGEVDLAGTTFDHEKKGKGHCKSCHTSVATPYEPKYNCIRCHGGKEILDAAKIPEKMHAIHVNNREIHYKVECFECHGLALPNAKAGAYVKKNLFMHKFHLTKQKMDCLDCHSGNKRPACIDCH